MALTAALSSIDFTGKNFHVYGTVTPSASFLSNGDVLDFSQLGIPSNQLPIAVYLYETTPAPGPAKGAEWLYVPGTTQANGLVEAFNGTTQLTASANTYASLTLGATFALAFEAIFPSEI
jgi:hypothetical protein